MKNEIISEVMLDQDELRWLYQFISNEDCQEYLIEEELENKIIIFTIGKNKNKKYYQKDIKIIDKY